MLARLHAQFHEIRLDLRGRRLRHRERLALRRLGEAVARAGVGGSEASARLVGEIVEGERRAAALMADSRASLEADRADLRAVAAWVKPAVVLRGLCTRLVLRHRRWLERRALRPRFEALGELATGSAERGDQPGSLAREVAAVRGRVAAVAAERERWVAPYGGRALPDWTARAGVEAVGVWTRGPDAAALAPVAEGARGRGPGGGMVDRQHLHRFPPPLRVSIAGHRKRRDPRGQLVHLRRDDLLAAAARGRAVRVSGRTVGGLLPRAGLGRSLSRGSAVT